MEPSQIIPLLSDDTKLSECIKRVEEEINGNKNESRNNNNNNNSNNNNGNASIAALRICQRVAQMKATHQQAVSSLLTSLDPSGNGTS